MRRIGRAQRGNALVTALALVAISTLSVTGVCLLATSSATQQRRQADYALSMNLAEAGINFELRYISTHQSSSPVGHLASNPYTGSLSGVPGSFTVFVRNTDGTSNWAPPSDAQIVSTGVVGGISRRVQVNCKGGPGGSGSIFNGKYALFGYSDVTFSGASSAINGDLGTDGTLEVKAGGNGSINGNIVLAGPAANMPSGNAITGRTVVRLSAKENWPTIDTIVAATFPSGWSSLTSSAAIAAQSARMRTYSSNSPVNTPSGTKQIGWTNQTTLSTSDFNKLNVNTLILPPGDYYFTDIQISGPASIVCDTAGQTVPGGTPGQVRIWMNGSTSNDTINADVTFTKASDPSMFRLYYNKVADISLAGNMTYYGGFYAVRSAGNSAIPSGSVTLNGSSKITGMVIADVANLTGGGVVTGVTSAAIANANDYSGPTGSYGFSGMWRELSYTSGASVFSDGTNR